MAVVNTPLGFQVPDGNDPIRNGDNVIATNAQLSQELHAEAKARLALVESVAGFDGDPLALSDEVVQSLVSGTTATQAALAASYAGITFIEVEKNRLGSDTSDTERWQRAVNKAIAAGIPLVRGTASSYEFFSRVDIKGANNLIIQGVGNKYVRMKSANPDGTNIFSISGGFNDIVIEGFDFVGTAIEKPAVPTRNRTYGPNPINSAVYMFGDLSLAPVSTSVINNFTLRGCRVYGSKNLPVWISGVRGKTTIVHNEFDNCFDPGLLYLENLEFAHNRVIRGRDNGVSVSRGVKKAIVHDNHFENCAHWAVHVAGFLTDPDRTNPANFGPEQVIVHDNIANSMGYGGINVEIGGKYGSIHDNLITDVGRGPIDEPSDSFSLGLYFAGLSDGAGGYSVYCEDWNVHDNTFRNIANGVVSISGGCKNIRVHHNRAFDIGSQYLADGTTAITPSDVGYNYGMRNGFSANTGISFEDNEFYETRATPRFGTPLILQGAFSARNKSVGHLGVMPAQSADVVSSLEIDNTSSTSKQLVFKSAGVKKATLQLDGTTDTLSFRMFDSAGAELFQPFSVRVSDGAFTHNTAVAFSRPIAVPRYASTGRPATSLGIGHMIFDTTLGIPLWWAGSVWVDAAGATR